MISSSRSSWMLDILSPPQRITAANSRQLIAEIDSNLENCFYSEQAARLITISQVVFRDDENIRFPNNKQLRVLTLEEASGRINPKFLRRIGHMNHHQPPRHPCTLYLKKPVEITCDVVLHIVNLARKIETQLSGRSVLPSVAVNLAASGMDQYALNIALKMSDEEKRDDLLLRLVDIYIKKSKRYNAKFLIDYFGTQAKKDEALAKLSRYCLGLHPPHISSALKTANQILDPKLMAIAYLGISGELTKGRQYQAALEIALRITDPNCQDQAVESLFHAWAQGSLRVAEAICLVHTFINSSIAPSAHLGIADFYIASNRFNEAKEKLNELQQIYPEAAKNCVKDLICAYLRQDRNEEAINEFKNFQTPDLEFKDRLASLFIRKYLSENSLSNLKEFLVEIKDITKRDEVIKAACIDLARWEKLDDAKTLAECLTDPNIKQALIEQLPKIKPVEFYLRPDAFKPKDPRKPPSAYVTASNV